MSTEPPVPPPPPDESLDRPTTASVQPPVSRRAADRPLSRDPTKAPIAVPIMGALSVIVAMLTLCAGGLRLVNPEGAVGVTALGPIFEVALARNAILVSMVTWVVMSILLAVAGAGLLLVRPWGRTLGLVYAWTSVAAMALMIAGNAVLLAPSLDGSDVGGSDVFWAVLAGPSLGCCPLVFALTLIVALHHEAVGLWASAQR